MTDERRADCDSMLFALSVVYSSNNNNTLLNTLRKMLLDSRQTVHTCTTTEFWCLDK